MRYMKFQFVCVYPLVLSGLLQLVCLTCQHVEIDTDGDEVGIEVRSAKVHGHSPVSSNPESENEIVSENRRKFKKGIGTVPKPKPKPKPKEPRSRKSAHDHCLDAHNYYRAMHNAPKMKTDPKILEWANKRAREIVKNFNHVQGAPYGENLAWVSKQHVSCPYMVKMWYDEIKLYNFRDPKFDMATGHFTQLVWKTSVRLGCGYYTAKGGTWVSCGYGPPGNWVGQFEQNVRPKKG